MEVHSRYYKLLEELVANSYITHKSFSLFLNKPNIIVDW